jgi:demethylmenaquinone methyltransferase/2-methoxy-6-polyprenyl-1,4-benzoquinol methylase
MMRPRFDLKIRDHLDRPEKKRLYNELHFSEAACRYDFATRAMSLGRDGAWKRALVAALPELETPCCLDLACGTGDIAFLLARRFPEGAILGLDLAEPMLDIARRRNRFAQVRFARGDLGATGLPTASFDLVTGSYAIRNAPELGAALDEIRRVLKPGGIAAFLDFSKSASPFWQRLQYRLLKNWCGLWGLLLHGNPEIHSYIAASLQAFPDRHELRGLLRRHGFDLMAERRFYGGLLEMLVVQKGLDPAGEVLAF